MKTLIKSMMMLAITIAVTSCQKESPSIDEPQPPQPPTEELITVGFKLAGDITVGESPLTRAASNDLYGVNVVIKDGNGYYQQVYALGIFDDISLLKVNLPKKTLFGIHIFVIKDGKTMYALNSNGVPTERPFQVSGAMNSYDTPTLKMNEMSYSRECSLYGYDYTVNNITHRFPQLVLYSGYKESIEAITQNEIITIPLAKASFGIKVKVLNLINGDKVAIHLYGRGGRVPFYVTDTFEGIFSYVPAYAKNIKYLAETDSFDFYSESEDMRVELIKPDGSKTTILNKSMEYKRNVMHSFTLDIEELVPSTGTVDTPLENNPMVDEDISI